MIVITIAGLYYFPTNTYYSYYFNTFVQTTIMYLLKNLLLTLLVMYCFISNAQNTIKVREYSGKHGLAQNTVNCLLEDREGFIWIGTQDGVNKFNGYNFEHYTNQPNDSSSLAENKTIRALAQDNSGNIWIGTSGNGVNLYNPYTKKIIRNEKIKGLQELQQSTIRSFGYDSLSNTMWICAEDYLYSYDIVKQQLINYGVELKKLKKEFIKFVSININKNYVIAVDREGIFFYNRIISKWNYRKLKTKKIAASSYQCTFVSDSILMLGTSADNIIILKLLKDSIYSYPGLTYIDNKTLTTSISLLPNHSFLFTTKNNGLYTNKDNQLSIDKLILTDENGYAITTEEFTTSLVSSKGTVWLGTLNNGMLKYQPENKVFNAIPALKGITIFGITEDIQNNIWLATEGKGLFQYNAKNKVSKQYIYPLNKNIIPYNSANSFYSLYCDKNNLLHIGNTVYGLNKFDITNQVNKRITPANKLLEANSGKIETTVLSIIKDSKQNTWVSTYGKGIFKTNSSETNTVQYHTMGNNSMSDVVFQILELQNGTLLAATANVGVMVYNTQLNAFKEYRELNRYLNSKCVNNILQYNSNTLIIATEGGIAIYDLLNQKGKALTTKDGLPSQTIYGLEKDDNGYVWLSSLKGLAKFNPLESPINISTYTVEDGLQDSEFNVLSHYKCADGRLVFGGLNGANAFYPKDIGMDNYAPQVYITNVKRNSMEAFATDTAYEYKHSMNFNHAEASGVIRFEFVGLSYKFPEKNKYQYMLEGFDKEWSEPSTDRFKEYTNLDGGTYTFKVRACNSDGVWNNTGANMRIEVAPIFYKRIWFIITSILFLTFIIYGYVKWSTYQVQQKNAQLEVAVEDRTKELATKNRDVIASIEYAKRIQDAILPDKKALFKSLPHSFILYKPKDIVSGDFYWYAIKSNCTIIAAVDCTGHGVPGAFMSMIGNNLLNQIVNEYDVHEPAIILDKLNEGLRLILKNGKYDAETTDGMDINICTIRGTQVSYAGAYRPLVYVENNELKKIDGDKFPIGGSKYITDKLYTQHELMLNVGDCIYLFSDGYGDQFGGEKGKKFSLKRMQELFTQIAPKPPKLQKMLVENAFLDWKNDLEQVDDVLVIGVKLS
ncbi:MAG: SpoIIE family protein phosphatase [Bacteroidia bacterium]|nr:SpoIIE family protein phosphatase [Bacteroidia bacterium]